MKGFFLLPIARPPAPPTRDTVASLRLRLARANNELTIATGEIIYLREQLGQVKETLRALQETVAAVFTT